MSIDSEDSPMEDALRSDLPSDQTAARMRRRLLAAGIAVGNGMAATTAAAGTTPGLLAGAAAKVGALSWGVKVGFAAALAIPTVGLLAERVQQPSAAVAPSKAPAAPVLPGAADDAVPHRPAAAVPDDAPAVNAPAGLPSRASAGSELDTKPRAVEPTLSPARPSQLAFDGTEVPAASKVTSTLAEETRILDAAFAELAAGNQERAAALVREHEMRFPKGLLGRERERAKARLNEISRGE
jgi:hypothetical protein